MKSSKNNHFPLNWIATIYRTGMGLSERTHRDVCDRVDSGLPTSQRGAEGRAQYLAGVARRRRLRLAECQRRPGADADRRASRQERTLLQSVPHDGSLLADTRGASDGTESPLGRDRRNSGDGYRISRAIAASFPRAAPRLPRC